MDSGEWVLVDVRPSNKYEASHPEGALNVPLYRLVRARAILYRNILSPAPQVIKGSSAGVAPRALCRAADKGFRVYGQG